MIYVTNHTILMFPVTVKFYEIERTKDVKFYLYRNQLSEVLCKWFDICGYGVLPDLNSSFDKLLTYQNKKVIRLILPLTFYEKLKSHFRYESKKYYYSIHN